MSYFPTNPDTLWTRASGRDPISHEAERRLNESGRRQTTATRILEALADGPKTNAELAAITVRFSARIFDLRHRGYTIKTELVGNDGVAVYTMEAKP